LVHSGVSHQVPQSLRLWIAEEAHLQPLAVDRYDQPFEPLELCQRDGAVAKSDRLTGAPAFRR
jgi:hypothetical protein